MIVIYRSLEGSFFFFLVSLFSFGTSHKWIRPKLAYLYLQCARLYKIMHYFSINSKSSSVSFSSSFSSAPSSRDVVPAPASCTQIRCQPIPACAWSSSPGRCLRPHPEGLAVSFGVIVEGSRARYPAVCLAVAFPFVVDDGAVGAVVRARDGDGSVTVDPPLHLVVPTYVPDPQSEGRG